MGNVPTLRPVQFIITPVVVMDDGESLTPVQVSPISIPAAQIAEFPAMFAAELEQHARDGVN